MNHPAPTAVESSADTASLAAAVARRIRDDILEGAFAPGQRLIEAELTRRSGAGRSTVREALSRLAADGLVEIEPHRGAVVRRLGRREVAEFYRVREVLEGLGARCAAECCGAGTEAGRAFAAGLATIERDRLPGDVLAYVGENRRFHQLVVATAANAVLARQLEQLIVPIFRLQFRVLMTAALIQRSLQDHELIARAVSAGDGDAADQAMRAHVRASAEEVGRLPDAIFA